MYSIDFLASTSADWSESIELIDADTNLPMTGLEDAEFSLTVDDNCGGAVLTGTTESGELVRPEPYIVTWSFPRARRGRLCSGNTYSVGLTLRDADGSTTQIIIGTLAVIDGVV